MCYSYFADLLHIARRCVPFTSTDGQAFVRLDDSSSSGFSRDDHATPRQILLDLAEPDRRFVTIPPNANAPMVFA
jgi:hypothetical protein